MSKQSQPQIQITLGLTPGSQKQVRVFADSPEERDEALARLSAAMPTLELFERAIQKPAIEPESPATLPVAGQ